MTFASDFSGPKDFVLASTNGGHVFAGGMNPTTLARVVKDTSDGITNGCCLRIDTPKSVDINSAAWMFPFNSTWTKNSQCWPFDTDLWIQFRFKIPASRLVLSITDSGNTGQKAWKFLNVATYSPENTQSQSFSNVSAEIVLQDTDQLGIPQAYHQDGNSYPPFSSPMGGQNTKQSGIDRGAPLTGGDRYCYAINGAATPACFFFPVDEWITVMLRIKVHQFGGTLGSTGNEFDQWVARRDATQWLKTHTERGFVLGDMTDPASSSGAAGFKMLNGGHFLTYESRRVSSTVDTYQKWDQLIVSTAQIALPAVGA